MWEQQEAKEDQPQATTLVDMLSMIAAHDQATQAAACDREEQARAVNQS